MDDIAHAGTFLLIFIRVINGILLEPHTSMKTRILLFFLLVISGGLAQGQDVFTNIKTAIKAGNSDQLAKYFNQNLDVNIEGSLNTFSKAQAAFAIAEFFKAHPPTDFTIVHKGSSQGGLQYAIGKYLSDKDSYSVLIRVKESASARLVHEISFVKEKK